jgi:hypothetical protein
LEEIVNTWKLSDAQSVALHLILSLLCSAVLAGIVAGYQIIVNNGAGFSLSLTWIVFCSAFIATFAKGLVPLKNNPKVVEQAALDTLSQIQASHPQLVQLLMSQLAMFFQQQQQPPPQGPLVVVHAAPQQVQAEVQAAPQRLAAIPPRPTAPPPVPNPQPVQPSVAAMETAKVQQVPQADFQRSWGDSGVVQVIQPR